MSWLFNLLCFYFYRLLQFKKKYLFIFRERGEGREKERERNINVWLPLMHPAPPTGHLASNPGMCPDWESNWQLFGSQAGTQSTELHQPGQLLQFSLWQCFWKYIIPQRKGVCINARFSVIEIVTCDIPYSPYKVPTALQVKVGLPI